MRPRSAAFDDERQHIMQIPQRMQAFHFGADAAGEHAGRKFAQRGVFQLHRGDCVERVVEPGGDGCGGLLQALVRSVLHIGALRPDESAGEHGQRDTADGQCRHDQLQQKRPLFQPCPHCRISPSNRQHCAAACERGEPRQKRCAKITCCIPPSSGSGCRDNPSRRSFPACSGRNPGFPRWTDRS